jgi:LemA protein
MIGWIILAVIVVAALAIVGVYNGLIQGRIQVKEGWSGIDVQLKRRHDLIPNLVATVQGYAKHEKGVLEEVTRLRAQVAGGGGDIQKTAALENNITQALRSLFAVAENYPDLKANQSFIELQRNLSEIEGEIQLARRYYNGTVRDYNIKVETFPSNVIANMFAFKAEQFFEVETATERAVPEVKF